MAMQTKTIDVSITDKRDHNFNGEPEVFIHSSLFIVFNTRTAEQLIYLQQPRASIDASLLDTASLRLTDAVGLQHTATARP